MHYQNKVISSLVIIFLGASSTQALARDPRNREAREARQERQGGGQQGSQPQSRPEPQARREQPEQRSEAPQRVHPGNREAHEERMQRQEERQSRPEPVARREQPVERSQPTEAPQQRVHPGNREAHEERMQRQEERQSRPEPVARREQPVERSQPTEEPQQRIHPGNREAHEERMQRQQNQPSQPDPVARRERPADRPSEVRTEAPRQVHPGNREAHQERLRHLEDVGQADQVRRGADAELGRQRAVQRSQEQAAPGRMNRPQRRAHDSDRAVEIPSDVRTQVGRHVTRVNGPYEYQNRSSRPLLDYAQYRARGFHNDAYYSNYSRHHSELYVRECRELNRSRGYIYEGYYEDQSYRYRYHRYHDRGFYGGYFYRPVYVEINIYFDYPMVNWMYASESDDRYYRTWYASDYDQYPVRPFKYSKVFYPTTKLKNLGIEVSAMKSAKQAQFRQGLELLVDGLTNRLSEYYGYRISFDKDDVVIDYYKNLGGEAIIVEGYFDRGDMHKAFKALIDLSDARRSLVFVPASVDPDEEQLGTLTQINDRVQALGFDPYTTEDEEIN